MKRLETAIGFIEKCGTLADVGCDHGYVARAVLDARLADRVVASDISPKSLFKAQQLLTSYENVRFTAGFGITEPCDTAVICGMGGPEIIKILTACKHEFPLPKSLILQPQNRAEDVRLYLTENGYAITRDEVAEEGGKFYFVMLAKKSGQRQRLDRAMQLYGAFCRNKSDGLLRLLQKQRQKYDAYPSTPKNDERKKIIRDLLD